MLLFVIYLALGSRKQLDFGLASFAVLVMTAIWIVIEWQWQMSHILSELLAEDNLENHESKICMMIYPSGHMQHDFTDSQKQKQKKKHF